MSDRITKIRIGRIGEGIMIGDEGDWAYRGNYFTAAQLPDVPMGRPTTLFVSKDDWVAAASQAINKGKC